MFEFVDRLPYYEEAVRDISHHLPNWMKSRVHFANAAQDANPDATAITLGSTTLSEMVFDLILESEQMMVKASLTLLYTDGSRGLHICPDKPSAHGGEPPVWVPGVQLPTR